MNMTIKLICAVLIWVIGVACGYAIILGLGRIIDKCILWFSNKGDKNGNKTDKKR